MQDNMNSKKRLIAEYMQGNDIPISQLDLTPRAYNTLRANGISYFSEILILDYQTIKSLPFMSASIAREVDMCKRYLLQEHKEWLPALLAITNDDSDKSTDSRSQQSTPSSKNETINKTKQDQTLYLQNKTESVQLAGESTPIEILDLSVRAYNCLKREQIHSIQALEKLTLEELEQIRNLGHKTAEEIRAKLEQYRKENRTGTNEHAEVSQEGFGRPSEAETVLEDIPVAEGALDLRPIECLSLSVRSYNALKRAGINSVQDFMDYPAEKLICIKNLGRKSIDELERIRKEYEPLFTPPPKTDYSIKDLMPLVMEAFVVPFKGLSYKEIKNALPELAKDDVIKKAVGTLIAEHKIEYVDFRCYKVYPSFYEEFESYLSTLKDRNHDVLKRRFAGETLDSIAMDLQITRERVRQIYAKSTRQMRILLANQNGDCVFSEDFYKPLFTKYNLPKTFWEQELSLSKDSINYLFSTYTLGSLSPANALNDEEIPVSLRYRLRNFLDRDKLHLDGMLFPKNRADLEAYALRKYAKDEITYERFVELYNGMLEVNEIPFDEKLYYVDSVLRTRANRLGDSLFCLWKHGERIRYYDIQSRDYTELLDVLQLSSLQNTEVSTLKFMNQYPDIMEKYDIRDSYELHNLLKKIADINHLNFIHFSRQPILLFGQFNRTEAIREIIETLSPITQAEVIDYLYDEFGYDKNTAVGYLSPFSTWYHNGVYSVNSKKIPKERIELLQANLTDDFYLITDIKTIYSSLFDHADTEEINPYTLKAMGFIVNSSYVIQNHLSAAAYFTYLLTKDDVFDISEYLKRFGRFTLFTQILYDLLKNRVILRFEKDKVIAMRRLKKLGITDEQINDYCESVQSFVDDESYFTVCSIRQQGFSHELDQLGFDDYFYSSLLGTYEGFSTQTFFGGIVLYKGNLLGRRNKTDFLLSQLREYDSVDPDEFIEDIEDRFGLKIPNRYEITTAVKESELYYDSIMDKVYRDKSVYYADFDE